MPGRDSPAILSVVGLLALAMICATVLAALDKIDGPLLVAAIFAPIVGGGIGFVAGTKGVQQGSQATATPPPTG